MAPSLRIDSAHRHADPQLTPLEVHVGRSLGGVIVQLCGELDFTNTHLIEAVLHRLRDDPLVYLDLAGLSFLDCAGVGAIIAAHQRQLRRSGRLILTNAGPRVSRVLQLTRADHLLWIDNHNPPHSLAGTG